MLTATLVYLTIGLVLSFILVDDADRKAITVPTYLILLLLLWPLPVAILLVRAALTGFYIKRRGQTIFQWKGFSKK